MAIVRVRPSRRTASSGRSMGIPLKKDSQALARRPIAFSDAEIVSFGGGAEEEELADLQAEGDASGDVSAITTTASSVRVLQQLSEAQQAVAAALAEARQRRGASQDRAQGDVVHL